MPKGIYQHKPEMKTGKNPNSHQPQCRFQKGHPNYCKKYYGGLREKSPNWKGGKTIHKGYVFIYQPKHPFCNSSGYVREHRFIIEKYIERFLLFQETPHHLNKIKTDNHIENLMVFVNHSAHKRFHKKPHNVKPEEIIFDGRKL